MANILDIRRRVRSVKNTRQITKAMKMVAAARLRRAQERALAARPYSQMLTAVLKSLVQRAEIYTRTYTLSLHDALPIWTWRISAAPISSMGRISSTSTRCETTDLNSLYSRYTESTSPRL